MASRFGSIGLDGASDRLQRAALATQVSGQLPTESGKTLVGMAKGVRLYLESRNHRLAEVLLNDIDSMMTPSDEVTDVLADAFKRHTEEVRRYIAV